jgi:hypothetical protein
MIMCVKTIMCNNPATDRQGRQDGQDAEEKGGQEEKERDQGDERDGPLVGSTT